VVTGKEPQAEPGTGLFAPRGKLEITRLGIVRAAEHGDVARQRRLGCVHVRLPQGPVRAQRGQQQLHQLGLVQNLLPRAAQAAQFAGEHRVRLGVKARSKMRQVRRAVA